MKKAKLQDGTNVFVLKIEQFVSLEKFSAALRNHFYNQISQELEEIIQDGHFGHSSPMLNFDEALHTIIANTLGHVNLTKVEAETILRKSLRLYGGEGQIDTTLYEGSYERGEALNKCYHLAYVWVSENYPHLIN